LKQFIIALALFLILLFFPAQFMLDDLNHKRVRAFDTIVQQSVQAARKEGYFTDENIDALRNKLASVFYINGSEIVINCTTTPKYRTKSFNPTELIYYEVSVPIKSIIAMRSFFNMSEADNQYTYTLKGYVASERLP